MIKLAVSANTGHGEYLKKYSEMDGKILIIGNGYIGNLLKEGLNCRLLKTEINSLKDVQRQIKKHKPQTIINCAGYMGQTNNVDGCEQNRDKSLFVNSYLPVILAESALREKINFIHISTGCIYHFDYLKDKPIEERQSPDYLDLFYSRTKIYAESALKVLSGQYNVLILRIRLPLDWRPHPKNLLTKLINYKKVIDLPNSVTYIPDFIKALRHLMKIKARGVYNVVNDGPLHYRELMDIYKKYVSDFTYEVVEHKALNLKRPNIILSTGKLERKGYKMRPIKAVLTECVKNYIINSNFKFRDYSFGDK